MLKLLKRWLFGKKILVWESWNEKTEQFLHNHIEDGWGIHFNLPTPSIPRHNCPEQKRAWKGQKWRVSKAYLINGTVEEI